MKIIWISSGPGNGIKKELLEITVIRKACDADIADMENGAVCIDVRIAGCGYIRKILPGIKKGTAVYYVSEQGDRRGTIIRGQDEYEAGTGRIRI